MKKSDRDLLKYADEKYIIEAEPAKKKAFSKLGIKAKIGLAAAACFVIFAVGGILTATAPLRQYADDEYYNVIKHMYTVKMESAQTALRETVYGWFDFNIKAAIPGTSEYPTYDSGTPSHGGTNLGGSQYGSTSGSTTEKPGYDDITDNRVEGVIEADRIKRTATHAFYINSGTEIFAYTINGDKSEKVGYFEISKKTDDLNPADIQILITKDCKTLLISTYGRYNDKKHTVIIAVDITDPANMTEKSRIALSGNNYELRLVDDCLTVINTSYYYHGNVDYADKYSYLPYYIKDSETTFIAPDDIVTFKDSVSSYTAITTLDVNELNVIDNIAYMMNYDGIVYMTKERLYLTRSSSNSKTEIICTDINDNTLSYARSFEVEGTITSQYNMDEYNGMLRVFTSKQFENGSAAFYCFDINTGKKLAEIKGFAPLNESVESVRFEKDKAYVCTAIRVTEDPVFFFDLSDINNITYTDTGTIPGYSFALKEFGDSLLLGIGQNEDLWFKLELYKEYDGKVISVAKFECPILTSSDYKDFYINKEEGLIGFGYALDSQARYEGTHGFLHNYGYMVLKLDGTDFNMLLNIDASNYYAKTYYADYRGFYDNGYFYTFCHDVFSADKISSNSKLFVNGKDISAKTIVNINSEAQYAELPLIEIAKALGAEVEYPESSFAEVTYEGKLYIFDLDFGYLRETGGNYWIINPHLDSPLNADFYFDRNGFIVDSKTAEKFICDIMGAEIDIDYENMVININK